VMPGLGDAYERVRDLGHASNAFIESWTAQFLERAQSAWEENKSKIEESLTQIKDAETEAKDFLGALEKAREEEKAKVQEAMQKLAEARVQEAAAQGPAKEAAAEKVNDAQGDLKTTKADMQAAVATAQTDLTNAEKKVTSLKAEHDKLVQQVQRTNKIIPGSGELLGAMLEDLTNQVMQRVMQTIEPKARDLVGRGFRLVRSALGGVAKAVVAALASVPFVGSALAPLGQIAYDAGLNMLEEIAFDRLKGIAERTLAKTLRGLMPVVMKEAQAQIAKSVHSECQKFGVCGPEGEMKFGALPPHQDWLNRALGCTRRPLIDREVYRQAELARRDLARQAEALERQAPELAKEMARGVLAHHGLAYEDVLAAAGGDEAARITGRFEEVVRALKVAVRKLRRDLRVAVR
jgi:hypothetical protein